MDPISFTAYKASSPVGEKWHERVLYGVLIAHAFFRLPGEQASWTCRCCRTCKQTMWIACSFPYRVAFISSAFFLGPASTLRWPTSRLLACSSLLSDRSSRFAGPYWNNIVFLDNLASLIWVYWASALVPLGLFCLENVKHHSSMSFGMRNTVFLCEFLYLGSLVLLYLNTVVPFVSLLNDIAGIDSLIFFMKCYRFAFFCRLSPLLQRRFH